MAVVICMCTYMYVCVCMCVCFPVVKNLSDVFYLCIIMMAYGPSFVKATIHGIVLNTVQSLASLPEVMANGRLRHMHTFVQYSVRSRIHVHMYIRISTLTTCTTMYV